MDLYRMTYICKCLNRQCKDDTSFPWPVTRITYIDYGFLKRYKR